MTSGDRRGEGELTVLTSTVRLFRVKGVSVGVHWTWGLVVLLMFWSLAAGVFPAWYPRLSGSTHLFMALVATVLFFGSIVVHELSHTLRAMREGVRIGEITLWLFGGVSRSEDPLPTPGSEFRVVIAGPLASAALALLFGGATALARLSGLPDSVVGVCDYLAVVNVLLLAFNLLPALPLDGGRIVHSALWRRSGDRLRATLAASFAGQVLAWTLIAIGLVGLLIGGGFGAVWIAFLGWFLLQAVHEEALSARVEHAVSTRHVSDLMSSAPLTVAPDETIESLLDRISERDVHQTYPVVENGRLVGLISLREAAGLHAQTRASTTVADVMRTGSDVPTVRADDPALSALDVLGREPGRAVVLDTGSQGVVGVLSRSDISHALRVDSLRLGTSGTRSRPRLLGVVLMVGLVCALAAAALYHPPFVVVSPGASFDVRSDISISGAPTQTPTGRYLLTSVYLEQPNAIGLALSVLRSDREIHPLGDLAPAGVPPADLDQFQHQLYLDSQQAAAVAAATAAGYEASLTGTGAEVVGVVKSSPAASVLRPGDVITSVDGVPVSTTSDLSEAVSGHTAGQHLVLTVERNGHQRQVEVETARLTQLTGGVGIGVVAQTRDLHAALPFSIQFRRRQDIGGPSAGLAYALAITDMLDRSDDARSRSVAATGTMDPSGAVGPVGGVHEKAIAARSVGADIFLVPAAELSAVHEPGLEVRGVRDLDKALRVLRSPT